MDSDLKYDFLKSVAFLDQIELTFCVSILRFLSTTTHWVVAGGTFPNFSNLVYFVLAI
jgi:hypothetical protein